MAKLKKEILGKVSGAVGDVLFRTVNGKTIVGTRPSSFTPGNDQASLERRGRFSMANKLARHIYSIYQVRTLWKDITPSGLSPFNMIVRTNYYNVTHNTVTDKVKLIPDIGFNVTVSTLTVDENSLQLSLAGITAESGIDTAAELQFQLVGVLYLSNPTEPQSIKYDFLRLVSVEQSLVLDTALNFQIQFVNQTSQFIAQYQDRKAFLALLTLDSDKNVVNFSNTFSS